MDAANDQEFVTRLCSSSRRRLTGPHPCPAQDLPRGGHTWEGGCGVDSVFKKVFSLRSGRTAMWKDILRTASGLGSYSLPMEA